MVIEFVFDVGYVNVEFFICVFQCLLGQVLCDFWCVFDWLCWWFVFVFFFSLRLFVMQVEIVNFFDIFVVMVEYLGLMVNVYDSM